MSPGRSHSKSTLTIPGNSFSLTKVKSTVALDEVLRFIFPLDLFALKRRESSPSAVAACFSTQRISKLWWELLRQRIQRNGTARSR